MATNANNIETFNSGIAKARAIIGMRILEALTGSAMRMLVDAELQKDYHNLTGNTLTSYSVGIYKDATLLRIININEVDDLESPTSKKLTNGIGVARILDYDSGKVVSVKRGNLIETDGRYGKDTSVSFLQSYSPNKKGWTAIMCTGTEYSDFLEKIRGLNVLSETAMISTRIVLQNLKPIK